MSEIFGRMGGPRDDAEVGEDQDARVDLSPRGARWIRRHLAGGVVAVTTSIEGRYRAATVSACIVTSLEPLLFLVSVEVESQMEGWIRETGSFGLSILPWTEQFLADRFAGLAPLASPTLSEIAHFAAITGAPLLRHSIGWADCEVVSVLETGDHTCFVGQAVTIGHGDQDHADPLVYYLNRYRRFH